jgi:hypothetical protein
MVNIVWIKQKKCNKYPKTSNGAPAPCSPFLKINSKITLLSLNFLEQ